MENLRIAFDTHDGVKPGEMKKVKIRPGYYQVTVYVIFDINMDVDFTRRVISLAYGHTISSPSLIKYSSVVSGESVRIAFILAYLNDLKISRCNGPIYNRLMKKPLEEKYSLDGAANGRPSRAQNDSFLVPHEDIPGSNPGRGKKLVFFKVSSN